METATGPTPPPPAPTMTPPPAPLPYATPYVTGERVRIGFLMRFVAALLDGIVVGLLARIPILVFGLIPHGAWIGGIVGGLLALAYMSLEVFKARSLAKMCFGYTITAQDGSPATRDQLLKRYLYKQLPQILGIVAAVPYLGLVSFVAALAGLVVAVGCLLALQPEHLALHDKLFKTAVFGPPTVHFTIPKMSDVLPTKAEVEAVKAQAAATVHATPPAAGPQTPPPPPVA